MDIDKFLNDGVTVKNPNYKKPTKRDPSGSPRFIQSSNFDDAVDRDSRVGSFLSQNSYDLTSLGNDENNYADYNVRINPVNSQEELNQARAKNQSAWEQTGRFVTQAVGNEIVLGTALGISNLVDMAVNVGKEAGENDYTNPFSTFLEGKQDEIKKAFEIYRENPNDSWQVGDFGWWADNAISVASTLSMLIPAAATTRALGYGAKLAKLEKVSMGIAKAAKAGNFTKGAYTLSKAINAGAEIGTAALLSRTMEGYLEARGVYKETYDKSLDRLSNMSDEERTKLFENNPDFVGKTNEEIASNMSSLSADETFKNDYAMLLFDIAQFKALGSMWKGLSNKAVNSGLRSANRSAISALAGESAETAGKLGFLGKRGEIIQHALKNPMTSIGAIEFSEGIEEGYQGIQTEKGKEVAEKMFDPNFNSRTLDSYLKDGAIWEQAFWGVLGGMGFQAAGTAFGNASNAIKGKINKSTMTEQEYALSQMTDEKIREQEINSRKARMQEYSEGMQLLNQGKNPFGYKLDPDTKQPIIIDGNQVNQDLNTDEVDQLKTKLTNDFVTNMVLDATDKGNYDLFKEYIKDQNFNRFFEEAGLTTDAGDKNFTNMLTQKMDETYEQYNGALYDIVNSIDVDNENVAKIVARSVARRKLDVADLQNSSDELAGQISTNADTMDYLDYEEFERIKYAEQRLNEIANKEEEINKLFENKAISPQAVEQLSKDNNIRRNQLLAFASANNMFGDPDTVNRILKSSIQNADTEGFIGAFNKYLADTETKTKPSTPKKSIQDLIKKKIELDDYVDYIDSTLPRNQQAYQAEYDDIARNVDRLTLERYNKAADIVSEYLESQPNLDEARDNIMTNNVPANVKEQLDILKLGHHSTQRFTAQINSVLGELNRDRERAAEEARNVNVDNNTTNDSSADNEIFDLNAVVQETTPEAVVDQEVDNSTSSTGEGQQSDLADTLVAEEVVNNVNPETVIPSFDINQEIQDIDKINDAIETQRANDFILDNDARATGLASSITFNLFKSSRNLFDNLEGKDTNSAEFNQIVDIVAEELFTQGVSRGYTRQAAADGIKLAMNMIYRRLNSKGISGADKFKRLADELATKQRVETDENGKASTTSLIPDIQFNQVVDEFIDSYIENRGIYTLKGSKTVINVEDLFRELLNNEGITFDQAKHIFYNIADYIRAKNNSKYIFTNKTELNRNLKTPSTFFANLINNKSVVDNIDNYMHIAAPSTLPDSYRDAVAKAVNGAPVNITYFQGEFGTSNKSISIKLDGTEIGYIGAVNVNPTNTGYSLKTQNKGFVYNLNNNNGIIESNLDKLFIPLINRENEQYSMLMDIAYKQYAYETANDNDNSSPMLSREDIDTVMNNNIIKSIIANNEIVIPKYYTTNTQKAQYIINTINNIIFYDVNATTAPMITESYSYWKTSTFNNYANTHKIQLALDANKKINTKLVNIVTGKVLLDATNKDINTIGFTYDQNPIMIVDANGNIINETNNTTYNNVAGFESGTMGMLVSDNPNAPIIALFTESNKLSSNKDLANNTYNEIVDLLNGFQNKDISFEVLGSSLGDLFSGPGIRSNNLFSGYSVIRTSDRIALNIQGRKGEYALIVHKFEQGTNKEGSGITHIPNGIRSDARSSISIDKSLNKAIAKEIVSNLTFNKTFYTVNNKNIDNDKSNRYLYKENGKMIVNIGGVSNTYNSFGHFVLTNNAFKTNQGVNKEGGYFDLTEKVKSLHINTAIITSPVEEVDVIKPITTATDLIKSATMSTSVNTSQVLNIAGVANDRVAVLTGTNSYGIELIPKESYFDGKTTKAEAYYSKGKMYFTNKGANSILKSPNNLIRLLIHENLHAKFEEQELFQRDGIVDNLLDTYDAMIVAINSDTTSEDAKRIRQWIANNKFNPNDYFTTLSAEQQRVWSSRNEEERNRQFAEEWLVESLTQPAIIRYLNNTIYSGPDISVEGIDNSAKTIWQKIIDILLKLFGRNDGNIRNNTILARQYSILGDTTDTSVESETNTDQEVEQNIDNNTPGETPLEDKTKDDTKVEVQDTPIVNDISVTSFQTESKKLDEESDIDDLDFAVTDIIEDSDENVKFGVDDVFNSYPELNTIGTKNQYSKYLDTIFPNTKVPVIMYHNTDNKFDINKFDNTKTMYFSSLNGGHFEPGPNDVKALLNIQNPNNVSNKEITLKTTKDKVANYINQGYDGLVANPDSYIQQVIEANENPDNYKDGLLFPEVVVFNSDQLYVLGSPKDIQGFKSFINSKTSDDIKIESYKESNSINMNGIQVVANMNDYLNQFADQDKPLIAKMLASGEVKFRCE